MNPFLQPTHPNVRHPSFNQTAMDLLKRYATLRRERTAAERELDDLTARHHAVRGEGLVQTLVRCSEDIEVVRVCDARLEDLRRPETLVEVVKYSYVDASRAALATKYANDARTSAYSQGASAVAAADKKCEDAAKATSNVKYWSWLQKPQYDIDPTAFVQDATMATNIMLSWKHCNTKVPLQKLHHSYMPLAESWLWRMSDHLSQEEAKEKKFQDMSKLEQAIMYMKGTGPTITFQPHSSYRNVATADEYTSMLEALEQARKEAADRISAAALTMASDLTGAAARTLQDELEAQKARVQRLTEELEETEAAVRASLGEDDEALKELFATMCGL